MKILIVEDEKSLRTALVKKFGKHFEVVAVNNGEQAKNLFDSSFDCVVTDLLMPIMTGEVLIKWIREDRNSKVPIIILSNWTQYHELAKKYGCTYFTKSDTPIKTVMDNLRKEVSSK